jgi:hypothetical protein
VDGVVLMEEESLPCTLFTSSDGSQTHREGGSRTHREHILEHKGNIKTRLRFEIKQIERFLSKKHLCHVAGKILKQKMKMKNEKKHLCHVAGKILDLCPSPPLPPPSYPTTPSCPSCSSAALLLSAASDICGTSVLLISVCVCV